MHAMNAWDWIWMTMMMSFWILPVVLAVYVAIRFANGRPGDRASE